MLPTPGAPRAAAAAQLLVLYHELDARIGRAGLSMDTGLPMLDGVRWNEESPLAGLTTDIDPFGDVERWHVEVNSFRATTRARPRPVRVRRGGRRRVQRAERYTGAPLTPAAPSLDIPVDDRERNNELLDTILDAPEPFDASGPLTAAEVSLALVAELLAETAAGFLVELAGPVIAIASYANAINEAMELSRNGARAWGVRFAAVGMSMMLGSEREPDHDLTGAEMLAAARQSHEVEVEYTQLVRYAGIAGSQVPHWVLEGAGEAAQVVNQTVRRAIERAHAAGHARIGPVLQQRVRRTAMEQFVETLRRRATTPRP